MIEDAITPFTGEGKIINYSYGDYSTGGGAHIWLIEHPVYGKGYISISSNELDRNSTDPWRSKMLQRAAESGLRMMKHNYEIDRAA